jgi:cytochrome c biogenesis protein CcdA
MVVIPLAFLAGLLSFFAPCGAFLLPGFFAYSFKRRGQLVAATWWFLAGFLTLFLPIGLGVHALAVPLSLHRVTLSWIGGIFLFVLAAMALTGRGLHFPTPVMPASRRGKSDALSVFLLGLIFGFTVAGCTAPLLALAFAFAVLSKNIVIAVATLCAFALGLVSPLLALAAVTDRTGLLTTMSRRVRLLGITFAGKRYEVPVTNVISAALLMIIGVVFIFTQGTFGLSTLARYPWIIEYNARAARFLSTFR